MTKIPIVRFQLWIYDLIASLLSSVIFYTIIPLPPRWTNNWSRIARWCPIIGLLIGLLLALVNILLGFCQMPNLTSKALIVAIWVAITGGLHLDGAMDTADGLSVTDPLRQLEVMKDSATGAFGAIAAIIILLLKTISLSDISLPLWLVLISAAGWARWGQVWAIAFYPYLRKTGKGSFHQENLRSPQDILLGLFVLVGCSGFWFTVASLSWLQVGVIILGNMAIAFLTGYWFNKQLGGHTGDTYGAVVEWSEALILCFLTVF
ncbi:adenosylcobinamide-GDP ribazoletransferase [Waterburya agarophytonicola K14]|uniref:Adenosylcobinamide-GDP ribazoletransferase n=1 Tax=Waterburya agarophytonicola KI4 TaxID=2874699 RepID=A0A964BWS6_9CYAN|nr:adenosylcobinamide-GDP ribazoletransferase [Waterburya agarophytonicola]MCC0179543.1 adenosylcobinamide-GDP ribazoletransferase [Waterburya agarophytonicola KI4]